jgi:AcrR family transcriptional regulator
MSTEKVTDKSVEEKRKRGRRRRYEKRRRAEHEAETRRRITEAAVKLHGSVGAARTTVSAIAEEAGVQRATVYRHFPDEDAVFEACSSHWIADNPPPDPAEWARIADVGERLRTAPRELYEYYERTEYMLENNTRDVAVVPALRPSMEQFGAYFDAARDLILQGTSRRGGERRLQAAAVGHALAFSTWRSLVREQGLSREDAVELMMRTAPC